MTPSPPPAPAPARDQVLVTDPPLVAAGPAPAAFPEQHPRLGRRVFFWRVPASTRTLNAVLYLLAAITALTLGAAAWGAVGVPGVAASGSALVLFAAVWALAPTPSGTDCGVYQLGITDGVQEVTWSSCRLALEGTRHLTALQSGGTLEGTPSFEVLVLGPEGEQLRIKGFGDTYASIFGWFQDHVLPLFMARERARYQAGEEVRCGRLRISQEGISEDEGPSLSWEDLQGVELSAGTFRIQARGREEVVEGLYANPNGPLLAEILEARGLLGEGAGES